MFIKPECPYCRNSMYKLIIYDGTQEQLVFTCACDGYIEAEIKEIEKDDDDE